MSPILGALLLSLVSPAHGRLEAGPGLYKSHNADLVSKSIAYIIGQVFAKQTSKISILTSFENESEKRFQLDALTSVLQHLSGSAAVSLCGFQKSPHSIFILANSHKSFRRGILSNRDDRYDFMGSILVYITHPISYSELKKIFKDCLELYIVNIYVVLKTRTGLELITYFPFTKDECFSYKPRTICILFNRSFQGVTRTKCVIRPKVLSNFHGCKLMATLFYMPPYVFFKTDKHGKAALSGLEGEIVTTLANRLNFTMAYIEPNITVTPNRMQLFLSGPGNFSVGRLSTAIVSRRVSSGIAYYKSDLLLVTRSGRSYYTLERFFVPASANVWYFLIGCLLISYVLVLYIYWKYPGGNFIHDTTHRYPTYWIWVASIGGPVHYNPRRTVARFVFLAWVLMVFFLRSGYQSFMYLSIQMDWKTYIPRNLEELLSSGYSLIGTQETYISVKEINQLAARVMVFNGSDVDILQFLERSTTDKMAVIVPKAIFQKYLPSSKPGLLVRLKEPLLEQLISMHFRRNSYLMVPFDQAIDVMSSSGLLAHWQKKFSPPLKSFYRTNEPARIKYQGVIGYLQIYAIGTMNSFIGLGIEFCSLKVQALKALLEL